MEEDVIQRIKKIISTYGMNENLLSKKIGIAQSTLNGYFSGNRRLSMTAVLAILNEFEDVSAEWLLRGVGDMYKNVEASTNIETEEEEDSPKDKFYKDIIFTYQERAKEYRKKIEYLEAELAKAAPFTEEESKKQSGAA